MMKKLLFLLIILLFGSEQSYAVNMVERENYLKDNLTIVGLPDFPPFSWFDKNYRLHSAFLQPTIDFMNKQNVSVTPPPVINKDMHDLQMILIDARSGLYNLFIGANSSTALYKGLEVIYPAVISNPIHVITYKDIAVQEKISNFDDLRHLHGVVSRSEYFSDFVLRNLKDLNVEFTNDSLEAYRKIITNEADYMLGSMYFNRIEASKYGLSTYLSYSKRPLFKIPMFIAISKETPLFSQYLSALKTAFADPNYSLAVKKEIIRIINEETEKNEGVVPPSFAVGENIKNKEPDTDEVFEDIELQDEPENKMNAKIIEHNNEPSPDQLWNEILEDL